jgi:hypothetical protein
MAARAGVQMASGPNEGESLRVRAEQLIRESNKLIHRSYALQRRTAALQDELRALQSCTEKGNPVRSLAWNQSSPLDWVVDLALRLTDASKGNLQLFDPTSGVLHIAAQSGFKRKFLQHFECVRAGEAAACGEALQTRSRVIVEDVTRSPVFHGTPALDVLLDAGVKAVQSTPLVSRSGAFLGMLSTHWESPHLPSSFDLARLDVLARSVAEWLEQP